MGDWTADRSGINILPSIIAPENLSPPAGFGTRIMPKQKTHKGMKKRFKLTATGKVKHRKANRGHKLSGKTGSRKRHLRQDGVIEGVFAKVIARGLAPGL